MSIKREIDRIEMAKSCIKCGKKPCFKICRRCRGPYYCSRKCQLKHWPSHKLTCHPLLSKRLLMSVKLFKEYGISKKEYGISKKEFYLFMPTYLTIKGTQQMVSPFNSGSSTSINCVICSRKVTYDGPLMDVMFTIPHNNLSITCYRCDACNAQNKRLCPVTFMDTSVCSNKYSYFFLYLEQLDIYIPQDIKQLLLNLMLWIKCC